MSSATENERRFNMSEINQTKTLIVTLHGNLARDPELRSTQERVISFAVYD
jgi:hypothetical protein